MTQLVVRSRQAGDVPTLVGLLQRTHDEQRYPVRQEAVTAGWLAPADELAAWVAVDRALPGATVLGHVALHPVHGESVALWSQVPGSPVVVSRLFTDGSRRGTGLRLLGVAVEEAHRLGRTPVLEVWCESPALDWYLRRGWRSLGVTDQVWGDQPVRVTALAEPAPIRRPAVA